MAVASVRSQSYHLSYTLPLPVHLNLPSAVKDRQLAEIPLHCYRTRGNERESERARERHPKQTKKIEREATGKTVLNLFPL